MKKIFLSLTLGLTLAASNAAFAQKKEANVIPVITQHICALPLVKKIV
ncbi:hypothetical protein ACT44C_19475 (plasmid) [Acinetobacter baumannii]